MGGSFAREAAQALSMGWPCRLFLFTLGVVLPNFRKDRFPMLAPNDLLVICDCDYLYGGVRAEYGHEYRVAYLKLKELVMRNRPEGTVAHFHAFIAVKSRPRTHAQLQLVSLLSQWGFDVHTGVLAYDAVTGEKQRDNITSIIIEFIKEFRCGKTPPLLDFPQTLVVTSGSTAYADLYDALQYQGVTVEVMCFGELSPRLYDVS